MTKMPRYQVVKKTDWSDENSHHYRVNCYPFKGVVHTTPSERSIGRFTRARTEHEPKGDAQIDLVGDIFYSLLKSDPKFKEQVPVGREVNKMLVEWAMENPEFEKARWSTIANLPVSTISAGLLWGLLVTDEALQDALKKQEEAEELMQEAASDYRTAANAARAGDQDVADGRIQAAKDKEEKAKQIAQSAADKVKKVKDHPIGKGMMMSAVKQTAEEAKDTADLVKSWGMNPGSMTAHDSQSMLEILHKNKRAILEIARLAGRFKDISSSTMEKVKQSYVGPISEPANVKDLLRLFPTERAYLSQYSPPYLRATKIVQLARSGLLGWRQKSEGKREGGMIAMVDGSGSMDGYQTTIAKGVSLGLAQALRDDNRPYRMCTFGWRDDGFIEIDQNDDWAKHINWAVKAPGGGTDFVAAFEKGVAEIRKSHKVGGKGHDMLFITDGEAYIDEETKKLWRDCRDETGSRLMYIDIGGRENSQIKELADIYVRVSSGQDLDKVADQLVVEMTELITRQR